MGRTQAAAIAMALALGCLFGKWPCPGVPAGDGVWRVWRVLEGLRAGKRQL